MKTKLYNIIFLFTFSLTVYSQQTSIKTDINYFFDNTEFNRSTVNDDQTMTGTHLQSVLNFRIDSTQSINAGINLLTLAGGIKIIERPSPIAFYNYKKQNMQLLAGAFPRKNLLDNYSDFFFQDSVINFRPIMHGIFWEVKKNKNRFFNIWLDWTGMKDSLNNESFFVGSSAQYSINNFYADFQSYMFHYAYPTTRIPDYYLCDNLLSQISLGYKIQNWAWIEKFNISSGILAGYERERAAVSPIHTPIGFVAKLEIEHKYIGLQSQLYLGEKRQILYPKYGNRVYWNNSFLRAGNYLETKLFLKLLNNKSVNARFTLNFHVSEGQLFHEQLFTVNASVDKLLSKMTK